MSALVAFVDRLFPATKAKAKPVRGRVAVVVRLYSGPTVAVEKCINVRYRRIGRNRLVLCPAGDEIKLRHPSFNGDWDMTKFTMSIDADILRDFETALPEWPVGRCPGKGAAVIVSARPGEPGLLTLSNSGWG